MATKQSSNRGMHLAILYVAFGGLAVHACTMHEESERLRLRIIDNEVALDIFKKGTSQRFVDIEDESKRQKDELRKKRSPLE